MLGGIASGHGLSRDLPTLPKPFRSGLSLPRFPKLCPQFGADKRGLKEIDYLDEDTTN